MSHLLWCGPTPTGAANTADVAPNTVEKVSAAGPNWNSGGIRPTLETPAVTMVAAWIRAETGVGPSIASPSQDCSGTCADLPHAPSRSSRPITVSLAWLALVAWESTGPMVKVPKVVNMTMTAIDRPMSPTRLTMNAFFAAVAALGLCCQKPISRYEARPTPSHPTYSNR